MTTTTAAKRRRKHAAHSYEEDTRSYVDHDGHEEEIEYDEHIWTSPVNAMKLVDVIGDTLAEADPPMRTHIIRGQKIIKKNWKRLTQAFARFPQTVSGT